MSLFNVAVSGLNAAKQALTTTSHNIANANNADYTRQEVVVASVEGVNSSSGAVGRGVAVQNVRRLSSDFLNERLTELASQLGFSQARASQLAELDRVSSNSETSLDGAMQAFFQAAQDLSVRPNDDSLKQSFLFAAEEFATRLNGLFTNVEVAKAQANSVIENSVLRVNELSAQIAELNLQISDSTTFQGKLRIEPNDLLDRREGLLKQLATETEIQVIRLDNGRINVNTKLGGALVSEGDAFTLATRPKSGSPNEIEIVRQLPGSQGQPDSFIPVPVKDFGTSRIGGALGFLGQDLASYTKDLRDIGRLTAFRANEIQGAKPDLFSFSGDRLAVTSGFTMDDIATSSGGSGNDRILLMANLFDSRSAPATTVNANDAKSISEIYRSRITQIGNTASGARNDVAAKELIRGQVESDRSSFSGVNLDEEAANLLRYQQAYSASGKVISISQDLFKELLDIAGR